MFYVLNQIWEGGEGNSTSFYFLFSLYITAYMYILYIGNIVNYC